MALTTMPSRSTTAMASGATEKAARYDGAEGAAGAAVGEGAGGGEGGEGGEDAGDPARGDVSVSLSVTAGRSRSVAGAGPSDVPLTTRSRSALDRCPCRKVCRS
ncbi:hypothetical protein GCM10019016_053880 [Streptomyces prasinosporus]|uniref:Uncharacterized protein n=1 Tax=Streptomyces prasinosporus TaxID=68256 RepID=A0ABP6TTY3_9ACTN